MVLHISSIVSFLLFYLSCPKNMPNILHILSALFQAQSSLSLKGGLKKSGTDLIISILKGVSNILCRSLVNMHFWFCRPNFWFFSYLPPNANHFKRGKRGKMTWGICQRIIHKKFHHEKPMQWHIVNSKLIPHPGPVFNELTSRHNDHISRRVFVWAKDGKCIEQCQSLTETIGHQPTELAH